MCVYLCMQVHIMDRCIRPFLMSFFKTPPYTLPLPHCMLFDSKAAVLQLAVRINSFNLNLSWN